MNSDGNAAQPFSSINFFVDGLGLEPREYVELLRKRVETHPLQPDFYSTGGLITQLEQKFAHLLGKERAIFLPTGSLANHIAVRCLAGNQRRVLVQADSYLYNDSGDGAETLSGLKLIPLAPGASTFRLTEVKSWVERPVQAQGRIEAGIGVIAIETPLRRRDHQMFEFDELAKISGYARQQDIRMHLDGARMFTLPFHSGKSVREHAMLFDTVYVSLKKHFNAAAGALLAGDSAVIEGLAHLRRTFGGALPHAWPQVALVDQFVDSYPEEYARAWSAAEEFVKPLEASGYFKVHRIPNGTSRFLLCVRGIQPDLFRERLGKRNIILPAPDQATGNFRMQVNPTLLRTIPSALAKTFIDEVVREE